MVCFGNLQEMLISLNKLGSDSNEPWCHPKPLCQRRSLWSNRLCLSVFVCRPGKSDVRQKKQTDAQNVHILNDRIGAVCCDSNVICGNYDAVVVTSQVCTRRLGSFICLFILTYLLQWRCVDSSWVESWVYGTLHLSQSRYIVITRWWIHTSKITLGYNLHKSSGEGSF